MANLLSYTGFVSDGPMESSVQGRFLGSFSSMPVADARYLGSTVLYLGTSTASYMKGSVYTCTSEVVGNATTYSWSKVDMTSFTVDTVPTQGSDNPITSGAVYTVDANIGTALASKFNISDMHTTSGDGASAGITQADPVALKGWVNSSIATNTANFIGTYDVVSDLNLTTSATTAQVEGALDSYSHTITPTNNDYCFVCYDYTDDPGNVDKYERYKYVVDATTPANTGWHYEYTLNNSSFTSQQWEAINSGATSSIISSVSSKVTTSGTMTSGHVVLSNGGTVIKDSGFTIGKSVPADAVFTDTTYSSLAASSGGTAVSLVTTGEKYTWNSKTSNTGTVTTTGTMTSGHVVLSNGGTVIKDSGFTIATSVPANAVFTDTNTKVSQTLQTGNYNLPLLMSYQTTSNTTATITNTCYRNNSIYANPSTGKITATGFIGALTGNADTATKLGTATKGSANLPIYLNAGVPTAISIDNTTTIGSLMNLTTWANSTNLVTRNVLAYWDGRYQTTSNSSNLSYCKKGAFGDAVTYGIGSVASGNTGLVKGGDVYTALTNGTVSKIGTATKGSATQPVYINAGTPTACTALSTGAYHNITISSSDPSGGSNGDIWIKYS